MELLGCKLPERTVIQRWIWLEENIFGNDIMIYPLDLNYFILQNPAKSIMDVLAGLELSESIDAQEVIIIKLLVNGLIPSVYCMVLQP